MVVAAVNAETSSAEAPDDAVVAADDFSRSRPNYCSSPCRQTHTPPPCMHPSLLRGPPTLGAGAVDRDRTIVAARRPEQVY